MKHVLNLTILLVALLGAGLAEAARIEKFCIGDRETDQTFTLIVEDDIARIEKPVGFRVEGMDSMPFEHDSSKAESSFIDTAGRTMKIFSPKGESSKSLIIWEAILQGEGGYKLMFVRNSSNANFGQVAFYCGERD